MFLVKNTHRTLGWVISSSLVLGACSVINSFDDVVSEESSGDGDGDGGGDGDGDGDGMGGMGGEPESTGGSESGGSGGRPNLGGDTGTGGDDPGTGGMAPVDPGLILAIGDDAAVRAISPQDGTVLGVEDSGSYSTLAFEPGRDLWYFVKDGALEVGGFDRAAGEFNFLTENVPAFDGTVFPWTEEFFAFPNVLALHVGDKLVAYDTTDETDITVIGEVDYPPPGAFWGSTLVRGNNGGNVAIVTMNCADPGDLTCPIEVTLIQVSTNGIEYLRDGVALPDFQNSSKKGSIAYDGPNSRLVVLVPNPSGPVVGGLAQAILLNSGSLVQQGEALVFQQPGDTISTIAVDPCHSVGYAGGPLSENVSGFSLVDANATPVFKSISSVGRDYEYEPYTRTFLHMDVGNVNSGVHSFELVPDPIDPGDVPDLRRRIAGWTVSPFTPRFMVVAEPEQPLCN